MELPLSPMGPRPLRAQLPMWPRCGAPQVPCEHSVLIRQRPQTGPRRVQPQSPIPIRIDCDDIEQCSENTFKTSKAFGPCTSPCGVEGKLEGLLTGLQPLNLGGCVTFNSLGLCERSQLRHAASASACWRTSGSSAFVADSHSFRYRSISSTSSTSWPRESSTRSTARSRSERLRSNDDRTDRSSPRTSAAAVAAFEPRSTPPCSAASRSASSCRSSSSSAATSGATRRGLPQLL